MSKIQEYLNALAPDTPWRIPDAVKRRRLEYLADAMERELRRLGAGGRIGGGYTNENRILFKFMPWPTTRYSMVRDNAHKLARAAGVSRVTTYYEDKPEGLEIYIAFVDTPPVTALVRTS